ncbi:hypothetical protein HYQ46_006463 [Verticillium longisporum]|nr:hypothetical protein HYQ46_006463 [Verticillium longisporum]
MHKRLSCDFLEVGKLFIFGLQGADCRHDGFIIRKVIFGVLRVDVINLGDNNSKRVCSNSVHNNDQLVESLEKVFGHGCARLERVSNSWEVNELDPLKVMRN